MSEATRNPFDSWGDEAMHTSLSGTFLQLEEAAPSEPELRAHGAAAAVYGIPWDAGSVSRSGAGYGPRAIRDASRQYIPYNAYLNYDVTADAKLVDCGNVAVAPANSEKTFGRAQKALSQIFAADALSILLGGDHSVSIPALRAVCEHRKRPGLILIDTHLDTAPDLAGEELTHGSPIARAVDAGFPGENMVLIGINGWMTPPRELEYAREHRMTIIWIEEIWRDGVEAAVQRALRIAGDGTDGLYLSVDIDSVDAAYAPGTGSPTVGGLTSREVIQLVRGLGSRPHRDGRGGSGPQPGPDTGRSGDGPARSTDRAGGARVPPRRAGALETRRLRPLVSPAVPREPRLRFDATSALGHCTGWTAVLDTIFTSQNVSPEVTGVLFPVNDTWVFRLVLEKARVETPQDQGADIRVTSHPPGTPDLRTASASPSV